ncbi:hypothetical protein GBZ48_10515 [Azospirillum melinis]|uniref:Uncharacterized protein n=1 Tax=Azospirillum melinis TaxID=328839 RepID=A0ABX2KEA0_9PROT|nr:hypothetical protein [Azospirillum melinis]MBP2304759.1 hypothetical protein [Azospirillum melinis]NUA99725.1 hypothetical protein [Azospirillum melinis]
MALLSDMQFHDVVGIREAACPSIVAGFECLVSLVRAQRRLGALKANLLTVGKPYGVGDTLRSSFAEVYRRNDVHSVLQTGAIAQISINTYKPKSLGK